MRKPRVLLCPLLFLAGLTAAAEAQPVLGGGLGGSTSLSREEASAALTTELTLRLPWRSLLFVGAHLVGSLEGYDGGYRCGMGTTTEAVPAVATTCLYPALSLQTALGVASSASRPWRVRIEGGPSLTLLWQVAGGSSASAFALRPGAVARGALLVRVGRLYGGRWWLGVQAGSGLLSGRGPDGLLPRAFGEAGLVFEAEVLD